MRGDQVTERVLSPVTSTSTAFLPDELKFTALEVTSLDPSAPEQYLEVFLLSPLFFYSELISAEFKRIHVCIASTKNMVRTWTKYDIMNTGGDVWVMDLH